MGLTCKVDASGFTSAMKGYVLAVDGDSREAALIAFRMFMRRLMGITPPAQGPRGADFQLTLDDRRRGESAITRDLALLFTGVVLKHKEREQWPDVSGIHRRLFIAGKKGGKPLPSDRARGAYYVDQGKLKALARDLMGAVGALAAGWLSGARAVAMTGIPAWVSRHPSSGGYHTLVLRTGHYQLTVANASVPPDLVPEMERRIPYALEYTANALIRMTEAIVAKRCGEFSASSSRS